MTVTHRRSRYTRGCRCNICITAEREYQRNRYRRRRGLPVDPPDHPPLGVVSAEESGNAGPVESAVATELSTICTAADRPGLSSGGSGPGADLGQPNKEPHDLHEHPRGAPSSDRPPQAASLANIYLRHFFRGRPRGRLARARWPDPLRNRRSGATRGESHSARRPPRLVPVVGVHREGRRAGRPAPNPSRLIEPIVFR
jgi:hypothetical protein